MLPLASFSMADENATPADRLKIWTDFLVAAKSFFFC
jgi:hypothetical protein